MTLIIVGDLGDRAMITNYHRVGKRRQQNDSNPTSIPCPPFRRIEMDRLEQYRETVKKILDDYAAIPHPYGKINNLVIVSGDRNHFLLVNEGWKGKKHIHHLSTGQKT